MVIFSTLFSLVCYFLFYTWLTTLANPLILMPQYSTFSIADIDYPAVALCNVNRISKKAMKNLALHMSVPYPDSMLIWERKTYLPRIYQLLIVPCKS